MNSNTLNAESSVSERSLARFAGVSRTTLRLFNEGKLNPTVQTLQKISEAQGLELDVIRYPQQSLIRSEFSIPMVSHLVELQGFDSWKIHFMNFVDEIRRSKDPRLFVLQPLKNLDPKLSALLAAIVLQICLEFNWSAPKWALEAPRLLSPWFVSQSDALKASAILESPICFKSKNIFVLDNFLQKSKIPPKTQFLIEEIFE